MTNIIFTIILVIVFLLSGKIIPALKKVIKIITNAFLKLLNLVGISIKTKEKKIKLSKEFKDTYKEIKIMKKSKSNLKPISYINWVYLVILLVSIILIIVNLNYISNNIISNLVFNILEPIKIVKTVSDANTLFTAAIFSILSFSFSKLIARWKETKEQRMEKRKNKIKEKALNLYTTSELLNQAKNKDDKAYKELK